MAKVSVKEVMGKLSIRNKTQLKSWVHCYRNEEIHRLHQPVGKGQPKITARPSTNT
ncbi:hypothetical protein [Psychrobacillus sp. L4]|uniref:hypothetical protein n=1 Tax=Psychrobacillus sp. L4 TaxID=3236892 RepID=UPI0036F39815